MNKKLKKLEKEALKSSLKSKQAITVKIEFKKRLQAKKRLLLRAKVFIIIGCLPFLNIFLFFFMERRDISKRFMFMLFFCPIFISLGLFLKSKANKQIRKLDDEAFEAGFDLYKL